MGRYRTSFAYDQCSNEQLEVELRTALARLDHLSNGNALRLRHNEEVANLNQLSKQKRAALRIEIMKAIAGLREEMRRRGMIFPATQP